MKKIKIVLVALLLLVLSLPTMAQNQKYVLNAYYFVAATDTEVLRSEDTDIDVVLDFDNMRVIIYSAVTQTIDFTPTRSYKDKDGFTVLESIATDANNEIMQFHIDVKKEENYIRLFLIYDYICVSYACRML